MRTTQYSLPRKSVFMKTPVAEPSHRGCNSARVVYDNYEDEVRKRLRWSFRISGNYTPEVKAARIQLGKALAVSRRTDFYARAQIVEACKAYDAAKGVTA